MRPDADPRRGLLSLAAAFVVLLAAAACSSVGGLSSQEPSLSPRGLTPGVLGQAMPVRPGMTYTIDRIELGGGQMCSRSDFLGSSNGHLLFVTLTIETTAELAPLSEGGYPYFEPLDFSMIAPDGREQRVNSEPENKEAAFCIDQNVNGLNGELQPNSQRTGQLAIDTWSPSGYFIFRTSGSEGWEFPYGSPDPEFGVQPESSDGQVAVPDAPACQLLRQDEAEDVLGAPVTRVDSETTYQSIGCAWVSGVDPNWSDSKILTVRINCGDAARIQYQIFESRTMKPVPGNIRGALHNPTSTNPQVFAILPKHCLIVVTSLPGTPLEPLAIALDLAIPRYDGTTQWQPS